MSITALHDATHPTGGRRAAVAGDTVARSSVTRGTWRRASAAPALVLLAFGSQAQTPAGPAAPPTSPAVLATVGDTVLTMAEFEQALRAGARGEFYHGTVPAGREAEFRREVAERLIDETVLVQEAARRGLAPDAAWVQARLDAVERRYGANPRWAEVREGVLARTREHLERKSVLLRLEEQTRTVPEPSEAELRTYHAANPDKFTEPARTRLSVILLQVEPSALPADWEAARGEADEILTRLRNGADFAAEAKRYSRDPSSARRGGDMGYVHDGMLGASVHAALDGLAEGDLSEPVTVLEGIAVFRVGERRPAERHDLEAVRERARALWVRERGETAWRALIAELRARTRITLDEEALGAAGHGAPPGAAPSSSL